MTDFAALSAEFPKAAISWRAQSVTKDGTKAMALAYIDARDVMQRLDDVCGPQGWQDRYEFAGPRTICYLSVRIGDEWVTKADGAGDTAVEAEKGAISDAFKRAAVKWGIGRYLYDLDAPWVPCETSEYGGKKHWKRWTADPWAFVRSSGIKPPSAAEMKRALADIDNELLDCRTVGDVNRCAKIWAEIMARDSWPSDWQEQAKPKFAARRSALTDNVDDFPGGRPTGAVANMMAG